jgi:hypothetical protein
MVKLLRFFGMASRVMTTTEFLAGEFDSSSVRLLCTTDELWNLMKKFEEHPNTIRHWNRCVHSAFVCAGSDVSARIESLKKLTNESHTSLMEVHPERGECIVSHELPAVCGALSGLRISLKSSESPSWNDAFCITRDGIKSVFINAAYERVPIFLSLYAEIIDIDTELDSGNFDIRHHLYSAAPIVMFIKWAFRATWNAPVVHACVVIDDPLLKPQYGFLNYQLLLELMHRHNFTTNVAFIPWNWRRSDRRVTKLFKEHPERLSLSIHGCDHTGDEFGTQNVERLAWKSQEAMDRMLRHQRETDVRHTPIMVFPQGVFSASAMPLLKQAQYLAAVNTEVVSIDRNRPPVTVADLWDIAVMKYGNCPLCTRRYPAQGVENFAFDALLGKPCFVVVHHDYCRDRCAPLVEFIEKLNKINCRLEWCGLGEAVKRSCRQRFVATHRLKTEMYGSQLRLENRSDQEKRFCIAKRESDPAAVKEVVAGSRSVQWRFSDGYIVFEVELAGGQSTTVDVRFHSLDPSLYRESCAYKLKTTLRRYLSEARDNYVAARHTIFPATRN